MTKKIREKTSRRKFLLAAGATGAATIAMPQVSRAQTATLECSRLVARQGHLQ